MLSGLCACSATASGASASFARVIGGQLADLSLISAIALLRGRVVDRGDRGDRLAAIAHLVARQRMLAARDRQHAEGLVAVGAGDDRLHAGKL